MTVLVVANMRRQRVNHLARHGVRSVAARAPGRVRGPGRGVGSIPTGLVWLGRCESSWRFSSWILSPNDKAHLCILSTGDKIVDWSAFCVTGLDGLRITAWISSWILSSSDKVHASILPVGGNIADWSAFCVTGLAGLRLYTRWRSC